MSRPASSPAPSNERSHPFAIAAALAVGAGLLAAGFWAGHAWSAWSRERMLPGGVTVTSVTGESPGKSYANPEQLSHLPAGNIVLLDALGNRVFALSTRSGSPGKDPLDLEALRVGTNGRMTAAGKFRLDPAHSELTDEAGNHYPVAVDGARIRILLGGGLVINSRPAGASVTVDGKSVGPAPQKLRLAAGVHHVRVEGRSEGRVWESENDVDVPSGRSFSITLGPQGGSQ